MARVKIDLGAEVDLLNRHELHGEVDRVLDYMRARAEGLKFVRPLTPADAIGPGGVIAMVPQGFVWMVTLATVTVTQAATVKIGRQPTARVPLAAPLVLTAAGPAVFTWSSRQVFLLGGDQLCAATSAGSIGQCSVNALEVPAEQLFKVMGG